MFTAYKRSIGTSTVRYPGSPQFHDFIFEHEAPRTGCNKMLLNTGRIYQQGIQTRTILLTIEDATKKDK
ncbi:MAG: hypothetical protein M1353_08330 [Nitrospirae bacterium]|nr:hypothetical protein [Nitrospirota bacterium]